MRASSYLFVLLGGTAFSGSSSRVHPAITIFTTFPAQFLLMLDTRRDGHFILPTAAIWWGRNFLSRIDPEIQFSRHNTFRFPAFS